MSLLLPSNVAKISEPWDNEATLASDRKENRPMVFDQAGRQILLREKLVEKDTRKNHSERYGKSGCSKEEEKNSPSENIFRPGLHRRLNLDERAAVH